MSTPMTDNNDPWAKFKSKPALKGQQPKPAEPISDPWSKFRPTSDQTQTITAGGDIPEPSYYGTGQGEAVRRRNQISWSNPSWALPHLQSVAAGIPIVRQSSTLTGATSPDMETFKAANPNTAATERAVGRGLPYLFTGGPVASGIAGLALEGTDAALSGQDAINTAIIAAIGGGSGAISSLGAKGLGKLGAGATERIANIPAALSRRFDYTDPLRGTSIYGRNAVLDAIRRDPTLRDPTHRQGAQQFMRMHNKPMSDVGPELERSRQAAREAVTELNARIDMNELNRPYRTPTTENVVDVRNIPQLATGDWTSLIPIRPLSDWAQRRAAARETRNLARAADTATEAEQIFSLGSDPGARALEQLVRANRSKEIGQQVFGPEMQSILRALLYGANPMTIPPQQPQQ